jgi:hypothetical protein
MSYRVKPDGTIECDSPTEALELQCLVVNRANAIPPNNHNPVGRVRVQSAADKAPNYRGFWESLNENGRKVTSVLAKNQSPIKTEIVSQQSGIASTDLPGVMIHVRSTASKNGIESAVVRGKVSEGRKVVSTYQLNDALRAGINPLVNSQA